MCKVIEDFKISLIEDGKSAKTIESYVGDIKAFKEFCQNVAGSGGRLCLQSVLSHVWMYTTEEL